MCEHLLYPLSYFYEGGRSIKRSDLPPLRRPREPSGCCGRLEEPRFHAGIDGDFDKVAEQELVRRWSSRKVMCSLLSQQLKVLFGGDPGRLLEGLLL